MTRPLTLVCHCSLLALRQPRRAAQTAREVSYTPQSVVPLHAKLRFTTMVDSAGAGGDPRLRLRRQGVLGRLRRPESRVRQAREGGRHDESQPRDRERPRLFVRADRRQRPTPT